MKDKDKQSGNGNSMYIINPGVTEQSETITPEKIKVIGYLFKEIDLDNEDNFKELGKEFDE